MTFRDHNCEVTESKPNNVMKAGKKVVKVSVVTRTQAEDSGSLNSSGHPSTEGPIC